MDDCCSGKADALEALRHRQSATLKVVLAINLIMFLAEFGIGLLANSAALLADSLDMLGDSLVYLFSLYVVARSDRWKAGSALLKAGAMAAFGVFVLCETGWKLLHPVMPAFDWMVGTGVVALAANAVCLYLLTRHRQDDVNMSSVWLCSRNDIIANVAVLGAAFAVLTTASAWPDLLVGAGIAILFLRSAWSVFADALQTLRQPPPLSARQVVMYSEPH
jgi:cation diffusion facilitator family transporter